MTSSFMNPDAQSRFLRAHQSFEQGKFQEVIFELQSVVGRPDSPCELENLFAAALTHVGRAREAEPFFQKWAVQQAQDFNQWMNLAWCQLQLRNYAGLWHTTQQALKIQTHHPEALEWGALAAWHQKDSVSVLSLQQRLLQVRPDYAHGHYKLGALYNELGLSEQANTQYKRALALEPHHGLAITDFVRIQHFLGEISPSEHLKENQFLAREVSRGIQPYRVWKSVCSVQKAPLRVGFVSPDLHEHPVAYFLSSILENSRQEAVQMFAYSDDDSEELSPWTQQLRQYFHRFHATAGWSDAAVAAQIHQDEIDVLFDLSGWLFGERLRVFAHKPAPVQLSWLGYFASTGLPAMDGIVADPCSIPQSEEDLYSEKVWRLPHARLVYTLLDAVRALPVAPLPAVDKGHFVFGCFQSLNKIHEGVLQAWGRVARQVPHAHWYIQSPHMSFPSSRADLQRRLEAVGIARDKIQLVGKQPFDAYMQSYARVDILLDTFPYPGGTTTLEALWMGVPTLTLATPGMLGRQGQALLTAAGMDAEWICHDTDTYVARAVQWAQESEWEKLAALRASLREQVRSSPVFDTKQFAQDWLALVREIWADACLSRPW